MPNWCDNTLTVTGEGDKLARFMDAVRLDRKQPLSFALIVPEPTGEAYAAMDEARKVECYMCAGRGKRPVTQAEADGWGCEFHPNVMPVLPYDDRQRCNVCNGSGRSLPRMELESWYCWRCAHWGCKWDASFDSVSDGAASASTVVVYKFETAWSPPIPFVLAASERFPELEFVLRYGDHGEFAGEFKCVAGVTIHHEELEVEEIGF